MITYIVRPLQILHIFPTTCNTSHNIHLLKNATTLSFKCFCSLPLTVHKQQQQLFYGPLSGTNRVSWYQKKHLSWSSTILYQLTPSTMIRGILSVQFMCLTVFVHNLLQVLFSLEPCTSFSLHFFIQSLPFFTNMPLPSHSVLLNTEIVLTVHKKVK